MVGLFGDGNGSSLINDMLVRPVQLLRTELSVQDQHLEACHFVEENQTAFLPCETAPDHFVQRVVSMQRVVDLFLVVEAHLPLKHHHAHLRPFDPHPLRPQGLGAELYGVLFGDEGEGGVGKGMVSDGLVGSDE